MPLVTRILDSVRFMKTSMDRSSILDALGVGAKPQLAPGRHAEYRKRASVAA